MPMDFPDMPSLVRAAKTHNFRDGHPDETEDHYRAALADHINPTSPIEAHEIRTGKGWDQWTEDEKIECIKHTCPALYKTIRREHP